MISLSFPLSILQPSSFSYSLPFIPTVLGHISKSSVGIVVPPPIYIYYIQISCRKPCPYLLKSCHHCIYSLNSLYGSGFCYYLLRWYLLSFLPYLGLWQYLPLLLLFQRSSPWFFLSSQLFLLPSTFSSISIQSCCSPEPLLN